MSEEDKKLLLEMKSNCLEDRGTSRITYNDEKRIKKAKAIDNALKEIERLNKIRQQVIDELFELKDMIYKPETREINFNVQRKISSMIVKLGSDKE